ncbi:MULTISPECIES: two-component regulator propeller domain-containing protein [unclassified Mucilaginibacter]|uniref:hybrid sensor histidine kinase/response regulator transcription factor n=1 Tax=unclassified Mucilaginibacter TaxID=2617802 RepID=UPI002AC97E23|nr:MULTISPECIES: two-component regulator propeller domain-containing protein [unclassified Mucilaginibacter]MEB0260091.1 two-component regulator propeller domain-containing protein [Mucilaginibacter sp. 10I4]MEB0279187.1 two-component regulator propeller domain-containing protein [Mucilaginibacter sp. 10B2]MEB0301971.1 two-component regulator propeller domain-containing protein [Mucilaginibacter sp. 5C4]WPX22366.1 two-component regulator propeller domain-containing protein [Mucilaginibacter sp.
MKYLYAALFAFVTMLYGNTCLAQYTYQQIDNSTGLSNSCINTIYQDSDNIIWFGTWDGLNFYDGNNIHVFNYEKDDNKRAIASNVIYQITGDKKRNIWIGTVQGLSKFNKNTGDFTNYFYNRQKVISNGYTVVVDNRDNVYAARRNSSEILKYNPVKDVFEEIKMNGTGEFMLLRILFDEQGTLWLLKDKGKLEAYQNTANGFTLQSRFNAVEDVDNIFMANHQVFYTTHNGNLVKITNDFERQELLKLPHEVRSMDFFKQHYVFAWSSKGIGEYDEQFRPVSTIATQIPVLQNVRVTSLMSDATNLLWFGTDGNGILKIVKKENYFGIVQKQPNGQSFHIPVRAFSDINDELWIGTKGNGIITIKDWGKKNVTFSAIKSFHTSVDLLDNCVYAIEKGGDGLAYIGSDAPGVTLYNLKSKQFIKWEDISNSKDYPAFGSVHCILPDKDGSVWLGLNESGLVHLKLEKKATGQVKISYLKTYHYTGNLNGPGGDVIYTIVSGNNDRLWIGCRYGGLSYFDKKQQRFTTLKAYAYEGSLSNNDVLSLYLDKARRLWVGTSFGLNWIDEAAAAKTATPVFNKLHVDNGLPNNTIHAISEDERNNIWISTNKGLAKINPLSLKIVHYKESDGLQSDEFSDNAVWKDRAGVMYFGGIYGFNYFMPQNIHVSNEQPHLLISDMQFAGKNQPERGLKVLTKDGSVVNQHYILKPQDNYFELNLQPITYVNSQKCQYAYFLEGSDKGWHYIGKHEKIIYNNLPPGDYTLRIKWSNGEGAWTRGITAFTVTVKQYWWLTGWAFIGYTALILISGFLFVRYRKNKFVMEQELKMEHMLREREENLHQDQINFFTNIAHELQTPLTLILGSLERYLFKTKTSDQPKQGGNFLSIVKQEASRLHYLVHQLLEFRKAESGQLKNHYTHIDISDLLTNRAGLFNALVEQKGLDYSIHIEPGISMWMDKDKLEKIVFNLLSNAFKHCDHDQYVIFSVHKAKEVGQLEVVVANSGCKLTAEEVNRLFDKFFVVDGSQRNKVSSGIGLAFTRQLVQLLHGSIHVKCENNWVSFHVNLPLKYVPQADEQLTDTDKAESSSYIFNSLTAAPQINTVTVGDNNKRSMIKSLEQEEKKVILIVDDEKFIRYLLKDILSDTYIIYEASTGKEALEVIHRATPDLIVSDIMMPDMNGLELCNLIKDTSETCHIPFVLLSARATIQHMTEGYSCGADAYIPKPFQTEHLLVRIQKLLEYRSRLHQLFNNGNVAAQLDSKDVSESDKKFIEKVTRVIEENIDQELDGAFLENALHLSKIQLYRKIKSLSDMTPTELIRNIRVQKAAALLTSSNLTVSEIFYRTGFNNKTYFFREFKRIFNCSPNEFRVQNRLPNVKASKSN